MTHAALQRPSNWHWVLPAWSLVLREQFLVIVGHENMGILNSFRRRLVVVIWAMAALPCFAGEVAVLRNGFSIRHERREVVGDTTRLYVTADGSSFVDVPTAEIEHFEAAPELAVSGS